MKSQYKAGFTIVELLIVVVVIAILAAITIVSYNGITASAEEAALKSSLRSASNKVAVEQAAKGSYPASLIDVGVDIDANTHTLQYTRGADSYCISAFLKKNTSRVFHISSLEGAIAEGACSGHTAPGEVALTAETCFIFSSGEITGYYDNEGDNPANPTCPRDLVIPSTIGGTSVTSIAQHSFRHSELTSVTIPDSVTSIGYGAFYTNQITSVTIPDSVTYMDHIVFSNNLLGPVSLPSHLSDIADGSGMAHYWIFYDNPSPTFTIRP